MVALHEAEQLSRDMGIGLLGEMPWGTHLCLFYETKEDLTDILVPYFKAGLQNNEFCMWITCDPSVISKPKEQWKRLSLVLTSTS